MTLTPEQMAAHSTMMGRLRREWLASRHKANPRCHYCRNLTVLYLGITSASPRFNEDFRATVDHRIPRARGGDDRAANWVLACYLCNCLKADMQPQAYIRELIWAGVR